ncbi:MAG TPA: DUF4262 domain-containing protein [Ilumatobacteraceae bacterium]|nr:DUF4262 domain-containing protein [Ilumatobacteraceae bacterium]
MCLECDGFSHEQVMRGLDLKIRTYGWALTQVDEGPSAFSYTIGLVESYGHPELIALDFDAKHHHPLISWLVDDIVEHGRITEARLALGGLRCVEVHPDHLVSDFFGGWANRYGHLPRPGQAMQVLLPDEAYCECHAHAVRRLDRPGPLPPALGHRANRAQRRAAGRRGPGGRAA